MNYFFDISIVFVLICFWYGVLSDVIVYKLEKTNVNNKTLKVIKEIGTIADFISFILLTLVVLYIISCKSL